MMNDSIMKLRAEMPALFAVTELDRLTGGGFRRRTLLNLKSLGRVPADIFIRSGARKLLIDRDKFLHWWTERLREG